MSNNRRNIVPTEDDVAEAFRVAMKDPAIGQLVSEVPACDALLPLLKALHRGGAFFGSAHSSVEILRNALEAEKGVR